ncbi:hypothetical protein LOZ10_006846 [Ophidiomyces ophidiicola]|nr:hypothetical protein LOZ10_006846 [Ophidiomyces ophidiicola]
MFLDGLKKTLNGQPVRTNSFGRTIIMSGLLSVSWHMNQRDLQVTSLGVTTAGDKWRAALLRAFDHWRRDFDDDDDDDDGGDDDGDDSDRGRVLGAQRLPAAPAVGAVLRGAGGVVLRLRAGRSASRAAARPARARRPAPRHAGLPRPRGRRRRARRPRAAARPQPLPRPAHGAARHLRGHALGAAAGGGRAARELHREAERRAGGRLT